MINDVTYCSASPSPLSTDSDCELIAQHAASFLRFTYRRDFPPLSPYTISSDAGWGCMLRCAQMLLGHVLLRLALGEDWRVPVNGEQIPSALRLNSLYRRTLRLFLDEPGPPHAFSLHHIVQAGMRYDKLPGEWFGPSTAALVLRDLVRVYQRHLRGKLAVYVTRGDVIYQTEAESLCRDTSLDASLLAYASSDSTEAVRVENLKRLSRRTQTRHTTLQTVTQTSEPEPFSAEDPNFFDPLMRPPPSAALPWASSLLLLVPLRLGVHSVSADHMDELRFYLRCPSCVGILGGRPQHAIYFTGHSQDGLLGLDPHTTFSAQHSRDPGASAFSADDASDDEYLSAPAATSFPSDALVNQLHVSRFVTLPFQQLDPSLAVGFCFRDRDAFASFIDGVQRRVQQRLDEQREVLFQAAHAPPSYYHDESNAVADTTNMDPPQDGCDYDEPELQQSDALGQKSKGVHPDVLRLMLGSDYEEDSRSTGDGDGKERVPTVAVSSNGNHDNDDDDFVFV